MAKRVAVVTGSNKGIGFAVVKALCSKFGGDVILTSRDEERGQAAVEKLQKEGLHPKLHLLDITDNDSICKLATFLKMEYGGLDVLVNNAAIAYKMADPAPFPEQAYNTVRINYFCTLNVCGQLFPLLRNHARVVNVSSSAGHISNVPSKILQEKFLSKSLTEEELSKLMSQFVEDAKANTHVKNGWSGSAYQMSKVGLTALTFLQHRKFSEEPERDIVVNAVHPGYVDTDMSSHKGPLTPDQGAEAIVYCSLLPPGVKSPRGEYIWNDKKIVPWLP